MRTSNSIKNSITSFVGNSLSLIIAFISQAIFIRLLGVEYLGLNGLFSNILSMLCIFELGIGNAIVFNLYKPISENDEKKISALMWFYKKAYSIIIVLILFFGLILIPFLPFFINEINIDINVNIVYILFLISTISSYFMAYKRNLIIANQKNYIINLIHVIYIIFLNVLQLLIIFFYKNYYLYLVIKILCQLLENLLISLFADFKYKSILNLKDEKLDSKTEKDIFTRVRSLIFHKIGGVIIFGTDNILISSFLGIATVGLYTNYNTVANGLNTIFGQIISSVTSSVGNLLLCDDDNKKFEVFKKIRFLNFIVSTFTSICFLVIVQPFIKIWVGSKFLLPLGVVFVIVFNYFQKMQRQVYGTFKDSAGIWFEDRYVPIIESTLNIVFSILFLKLFGLSGVFMGTIISGLALWCYSYPKFVYKKLFKRSYIDYAKETLSYIIIFSVLSLFTYYISSLFVFDNLWLKLIINCLIAVFIPSLVLFLIFKNTTEFKYYCNLLKNMLNKIKGSLSNSVGEGL